MFSIEMHFDDEEHDFRPVFVCLLDFYDLSRNQSSDLSMRASH